MKVEHGSGWMRLAAVAALALATGLPAVAETPDRPTVAMDGQWHFAAAPYFWFSGIKGDVSVRNLPEVPIEKSFSDIWSNFQIGALGHFEGRKDRWGVASDLMYMDLHAPVAAGAPLLSQLDAEATVKSFTAEGLGFYRAVSGGHEDSVRYYKMSGQLSALVFDWVDAMAGVRSFPGPAHLRLP